MKRLRFTEEQIIGVLREQEAGAKTGKVTGRSILRLITDRKHRRQNREF